MDSLCIPRGMIFNTTTEVEKVFNDLFGVPMVERVDERIKEIPTGQQFKVFYIHFVEQAVLPPQAITFYNKLNNESVVHVMTGKGKWFWKVYRNTSVKSAVKQTPRIMTEEDEKLFLQWKNERSQQDANLQVPDEEEIEEISQEIRKDQEEKMIEIADELHRLELEEDEEDLMAIADEMANV